MSQAQPTPRGRPRSKAVAAAAALAAWAALSATSLLLPACAPTPGDDDDGDDDSPFDPGPSPYSMDTVLQLPHVQAKGTHNSYHLEPDNPIDASHYYSHAPLDEQLDEHGVRQFELDLHYRWGVGFEIFHLPAVDDGTTCLAFVDCLGLVRAWSDVNPWHLPVVFWLEPKADIDSLDPDLDDLDTHYGELEDEILSVFPRSRIVAPDDVRGDHPDLPTAILADGWPTLGSQRGKVLFAMLDSSDQRDVYVDGDPSLAGRLLFVNSDSPSDPWAAMFKINNAQGEAARVGELVQQGFVVTSNAGSADGGDADNAARWDASLAAGANFLSTDFPAARDEGWFAEVPGGTPARCNPVSAPEGCVAAEVEALP